MGIEQITIKKWLAMKWYGKLIDLIIYVHIVNLLQLTVQTQHNIIIATLNRALPWSYCVKLIEQAKTKYKTAIKAME